MNLELPAVDEALADVRRLLDDSGVSYKLVGGVAVVHHGYARTTEDVDVLIQGDAMARLQPILASHGFAAVSGTRLRHLSSGVRVDLLIAGSPMPRAGSGEYPSPEALPGSPRDTHIVGLSGLLELKLRSRRHRDAADIVELLKRVDEARYTELEASFDPALRPDLATLRRDALEEIAESPNDEPV
jgi:hypothetical protein